uniref:Uncharacterized protein n=1 Tax=Rhizophora mucronata TaxID=61149 RepID=A0A2P2NH02_RHIMU
MLVVNLLIFFLAKASNMASYIKASSNTCLSEIGLNIFTIGLIPSPKPFKKLEMKESLGKGLLIEI